jgi:hypothetical protein
MNSSLWVKYPTVGRAADEALTLVLQITHQGGAEDPQLTGNIEHPRSQQLGYHSILSIGVRRSGRVERRRICV